VMVIADHRLDEPYVDTAGFGQETRGQR